jgi:cell division protease FtsH
VGHALESNKTVTGDDIKAVIEGEQGPLVDGRDYHTEYFEAEAEKYHELVVAAHKGHGKVDVPLPQPNGQRAGPPSPVAELEPAADESEGDGH